MENIFLIKVEIIVFFMSISYITYYGLDKLKNTYFKLRDIVEPKKRPTRVKNVKHLSSSNNKKEDLRETKRVEKKKELTKEQVNRINELLKRAKVNSSKWHLSAAKNLIVEWLAIDKYNKNLNFELASIYESEKNYKNAQYIYKDLMDNLWNKFILSKKMASVLLKQWFTKKAIKFYKKALKKKPSDIETIEILSELNFDIKDYEASLVYTVMYLKDNPRDPNKLMIRWFCLEKVRDLRWAIVQYKKVLEMQPYNSEIRDRIEKLERKLEKLEEKEENQRFEEEELRAREIEEQIVQEVENESKEVKENLGSKEQKEEVKNKEVQQTKEQ